MGLEVGNLNCDGDVESGSRNVKVAPGSEM